MTMTGQTCDGKMMWWEDQSWLETSQVWDGNWDESWDSAWNEGQEYWD